MLPEPLPFRTRPESTSIYRPRATTADVAVVVDMDCIDSAINAVTQRVRFPFGRVDSWGARGSRAQFRLEREDASIGSARLIGSLRRGEARLARSMLLFGLPRGLYMCVGVRLRSLFGSVSFVYRPRRSLEN